MNNNKKNYIILLSLLLITSCGEKAETSSDTKSEVQNHNQLEGVDIKSVLEIALLDKNVTYSAPDPSTIKKAFEPCKLDGEGGEMKGSCPIHADGSYLVNVEENPKHDNKVDITTSGPRTMVSFIELKSDNPNSIHYALNEEYYKQVTLGCDDERIGTWEFKKVSLNNKKDFVIAVNKNISAGSGWGTLRIYLDGTTPENACESLAMEESVNSLATTDRTRAEFQNSNEEELELLASCYGAISSLQKRLEDVSGYQQQVKKQFKPEVINLFTTAAKKTEDCFNKGGRDISECAAIVNMSRQETKAYEKFNSTVTSASNMTTGDLKFRAGITCAGKFNQQPPQVNAETKPKNYTQLFVCFSDINYLPAARTLTETLIGYLQGGQDLAYAEVMQRSSSHFSGSSVGGGCTQHGFAVKELPKGNGELTKFSENSNYIYWVHATRGIGGGAYTAIAETK